MSTFKSHVPSKPINIQKKSSINFIKTVASPYKQNMNNIHNSDKDKIVNVQTYKNETESEYLIIILKLQDNKHNDDNNSIKKHNSNKIASHSNTNKKRDSKQHYHRRNLKNNIYQSMSSEQYSHTVPAHKSATQFHFFINNQTTIQYTSKASIRTLTIY